MVQARTHLDDGAGKAIIDRIGKPVRNDAVHLAVRNQPHFWHRHEQLQHAPQSAETRLELVDRDDGLLTRVREAPVQLLAMPIRDRQFAN